MDLVANLSQGDINRVDVKDQMRRVRYGILSRFRVRIVQWKATLRRGKNSVGRMD